MNITYFSEERSFFVFRVEQFQKNSLLGLLYRGDGTNTVLRNAGNFTSPYGIAFKMIWFWIKESLLTWYQGLQYHTPSGPGWLSVETRYGLDCPGIESRWGREYPHLSRPALRPTRPPIQWVPGIKRPGPGVDHPPPARAEVKERVDLYLYSPSVPSWPVLGWNLPLPYTPSNGELEDGLCCFLLQLPPPEIKSSYILLVIGTVSRVLFVVS